jgi:hypothetical protein
VDLKNLQKTNKSEFEKAEKSSVFKKIRQTSKFLLQKLEKLQIRKILMLNFKKLLHSRIYRKQPEFFFQKIKIR